MGDEAPAPAGGRGPWRRRGSDLLDVRGLEALRTVDDLELHRVALTERAEAVRLDGGVVDEDILATVLRDEPEALRVVEPLDRALRHCCDLLSGSPLARKTRLGVAAQPPVPSAKTGEKVSRGYAFVNIPRRP